MKKIIMFVMVFAISAPALADDLNPPDWAGAPGTIYGIWGFPSLGSDEDLGGDCPEEGEMVPHGTNPDPAENVSTTDTDEIAHKHMMINEDIDLSWKAYYEGREGVLLFTKGYPTGVNFGLYNFPGEGTKLIRMQITWWSESSRIDDIWIEAEGGSFGPYDEWGNTPSDVLVKTIDVGDGWTHSTYEFEIEGNPSEEGIWMNSIGGGVVAFDQIVIDTICYTGELPDKPGRKVVKPPVTVDTSDMPVYEPQDMGPPTGPPPAGSTTGQLFVNLTWPPSAMHDGEPNYIDFTATVVIDPNEGPGLNEDFIFADSTDLTNGTIALNFDETDWDIPQPVDVNAIVDLDREGYMRYPIELTVTIDIADPNFGNPTPVVVTNTVGVVDNDVPYISVLPAMAFDNVLMENEPCVSVCVNVVLSHLPTDDVYVLVRRTIPEEGSSIVVLESMSVMDPSLFEWSDPNKLLFTVSGNPTWIPGTMTSDWDVAQEICLEARDDDVLASGAWPIEWVRGEIVLTPYSEDERYRVSQLNADGSAAPMIPDDPCDPCGPGTRVSGGEAKETTVDFDVQDNECGSVDYPPYDVNEDCVVDLSEVAILYSQWLFCTDPYDHEDYGVWGDCDAAWNLVPPL